MTNGAGWAVSGSRSRLRLGLGAAALLAPLSVMLPGPWMWFFMTPLLWGIWGAGWKERMLYTAGWGGALLVVVGYPLLHIDPRSFIYTLVIWESFYLLLGLLLIPWGRAGAGHPVAQVLSPAVVWLGLSRIYVLQIPPGDFWMLPATGAPWPGEIVSLVGAWGLSALMLTTGAALAMLGTSARKSGLRALAVLCVLIPALVFVAPRPRPADRDPFTISLLQGDFGRPWEERVALLDSLILPTYLELYRQRAPSSDLIAAPEYALPVALEDRPDIIETIQATVDSFGAALLIGAEGRVPGQQDQYYNMAWMFRPRQPLQGAAAPYPVPYTLHETVPGPRPAAFEVPTRMGVLLCYDVAIPRLCRILGHTNGLLVMITNQQGFDGTPTKRLLRGLARLRAAETGRFLAIAANTGPTGIIDPRGKALGWAGRGCRTVRGTIRLTERPSWYVLYGYWVLWAVWGLGLAFSAWSVRPRHAKGGPENAERRS